MTTGKKPVSHRACKWLHRTAILAGMLIGGMIGYYLWYIDFL